MIPRVLERNDLMLFMIPRGLLIDQHARIDDMYTQTKERLLCIELLGLFTTLSTRTHISRSLHFDAVSGSRRAKTSVTTSPFTVTEQPSDHEKALKLLDTICERREPPFMAPSSMPLALAIVVHFCTCMHLRG